MGKSNPDVLKKLNDLLAKQANKPESRHRLDLTSEQKLMWFDSLSHLCDAPRRGLSGNAQLRTICGAPVTTTRIALVEDSEFFDPSCPQCFAKNLSELPSFARVRLGSGRVAMSAYTLAILMLGIYFAPSFTQTAKNADPSGPVLASTASAEPGHGQQVIHVQSAHRRPTGLEDFKRRALRRS